MLPYVHLKVVRHNEVTAVHLVDQHLLDRQVINDMQDELIQFIEATKPLKLLVNFGTVVRCGSEAVGALVRARKRVASYGGDLKFCGMRGEIREIFKLLKMDGTLFQIYDSASQALAAF